MLPLSTKKTPNKTPNKLAQKMFQKQSRLHDDSDLVFVISKIVVNGIKGSESRQRGIYLKMYWMEEKESNNNNGTQQNTSSSFIFSNLERINETKQQTDINYNYEDSEFESSLTFILPQSSISSSSSSIIIIIIIPNIIVSLLI